jgi:hypothetical protein
LQAAPVISVVSTPTGLSFPDFEEGSRLDELVDKIANALGTSARKPIGSSFEVLVGFEGYPEQFALWWDGFTCELGRSSDCGAKLDVVLQRLQASGLFEKR